MFWNFGQLIIIYLTNANVKTGIVQLAYKTQDTTDIFYIYC